MTRREEELALEPTDWEAFEREVELRLARECNSRNEDALARVRATREPRGIEERRAARAQIDSAMRCDMMNAGFRGQRICRADFRNTILMNADFRDATLIDVDFRGADLGNADFSGADLRGVRF